MRKLFVIALLVALIPFTTGCRVGGLWGYDDDSGSNIGGTAAALVVPFVAPVIKVPTANGVLANLEGTNPSNLRCFIKVTAAKSASGWLEMTKSGPTATDANVYFSLPAGTTLKADELLLGTGNKMQFRFETISTAGAPVVVDVVTIPVQTTAETLVTQSVAAEVNFTTNSATVSYTSSTTTTYTTVNFPATPASTDTPAVSNPETGALSIVDIAYSTNDTTYASLSRAIAAPTNIQKTNLQDMYFRVTFSDAITNTADVAFTMTADNTKTTSKTTISTLAGNATSTWSNGNKTVTVKVTSSVALVETGNYVLTLTSFNGTATGKTALVLPVYAYFVPAQTSVTGITVNGTAYAQPVPAGTTNTTVVVTLSNAVTAPTAPGYVKLTRYATSARTGTPELTATFELKDVSTFNGTSWTMTFNQPLVAGKFYRVEYVSGVLYDTNGLAVAIQSPIDFATAQ